MTTHQHQIARLQVPHAPQVRQVPRQARRVFTIALGAKSRQMLNDLSVLIARAGGPDTPHAAALADHAAEVFERTLTTAQRAALALYRRGRVAALFFAGALAPCDDDIPAELPPLDALKHDGFNVVLASRSQILLAAVNQRAFAYDIENHGKIVRFVGNFEAGDPAAGDKSSSHHGGLLAPHTEGPYHALARIRDNHSPAPSSLILTARYNPLAEPTAIVDIVPLLDAMPSSRLLWLSFEEFEFDRSDSYLQTSEPPNATALLEYDERGELALKFNLKRVHARPHASPGAADSLAALIEAIAKAPVARVALDPTKALLINNSQVVHGRDRIADPRRLLLRLFGYRNTVPHVVMRADPLLVRG